MFLKIYIKAMEGALHFLDKGLLFLSSREEGQDLPDKYFFYKSKAILSRNKAAKGIEELRKKVQERG